MFQMINPIPDIVPNMLDPVGEMAVRKVLEMLGLTDIFKNNIFMFSNVESSSRLTGDDNNRLLRDDRIKCVVTHNLNPKNVEWDMLIDRHIQSENHFLKRYGDYFHILKDRVNKLELYVHDVPAMFTIDCEMQVKDSNMAYIIPSLIWNVFSNGDTFKYIDLMYDFPIHMNTLKTLFNLFEMTKYRQEHNINFVDYLMILSKNKIILKENRHIPNHKELVIQRTMSDVILKLDYNEDGPVAVKENKKTSTFNIPFRIVMQLSRPDNSLLRYPMVINNQLVPSLYIPNYNMPPLAPKYIYPDVPMHLYQKYIEGIQQHISMRFYDEDELQSMYNGDSKWRSYAGNMWLWSNMNHILRAPYYDNWGYDITYQKLFRYKFLPKFIIGFSLDEKEITTEEGETIVVQNDSVLDIPELLKEYWPLVSDTLLNELRSYDKDDKSLFIPINKNDILIQVYRDDDLLDYNQLTYDHGILYVQSNKPEKIHRCVISLTYKEYKNGSIQTNRVNVFDVISTPLSQYGRKSI